MKKDARDQEPGGSCYLAEILQYHCEAARQVRCYPIPRIFRICPNTPAVEVTTVVSLDLTIGDVIVPEDLAQKLPKGKSWSGPIE